MVTVFLSLQIHTHRETEGFHHCFSLHLPIFHTAAQHPLTLMTSALHRTSTCTWRSVGHLPSWCFAVVQLCLTLCDPLDCRMPGFPLWPLGLQRSRLPCPSPSPGTCSNYVHWVGDAIQPSRPLSSPSPPAFNLYQHQGLFQWVGSLHQVLELQLQHQSFQWIFRVDFL